MIIVYCFPFPHKSTQNIWLRLSCLLEFQVEKSRVFDNIQSLPEHLPL